MPPQSHNSASDMSNSIIDPSSQSFLQQQEINDNLTGTRQSIRVSIESTIGAALGREVLEVRLNDRVESIILKFVEKIGAPSSSAFILRDENNLVLDGLKTVKEIGLKDGDFLYLSTLESDPPLFAYTRWWHIALLSGIFGLCLFGGVFAAYMTKYSSTYAYSILLDAGSVHTSVYMYRYTDQIEGTGIVDQVYSCDIGQVGISSFMSHPVDVRDYINDTCFREAAAKISKSPKSPVSLAGTAGMRNLKLMNPEGANWIIGNLTDELQQLSGGDRDVKVEIISGEREGLNGWVTANYLARNLDGLEDFYETKEDENPAEEGPETLGALDWGGASTEITFQVPMSEANYDLTLYGKTYHLYTISHLCYGQAMSLFRHRAGIFYDLYILNNNTLPKRVFDPCAPKGTKYKHSIKEIFDTACTQFQDEAFMQTVMKMNGSVIYTGSGDLDQCRNITEQAFDFKLCQTRYKQYSTEAVCMDPAEILPPPKIKFYAFSTYFHLTKDLGLPHNHEMSSILDNVELFCSKTRSELLETGFSERMVESACFMSRFMRLLLTRGYHFDSESYKNITFVNTIQGSQVGWTLGHTIINSNEMNALAPTVYMSDMMIVVLTALAFGFTVLFLFFAYQGRKIRRGNRSYQRFDGTP